ncbi:MAG: abortive infection family protein [Cellvibrionaceae bacterium]|nr:abortive infection family protein [Cellvibrionaceae bacterium]
MDKLRAILDQYHRWKPLEMYIERMEAHLETDFSISIENAKALLESIGKEICTCQCVPLGTNPSINAVLKKSFVAIGYTSEELVTQVSASLATIGQLIGNLRNEVSPTSHGKSLAELQSRNSKVDLLTREFLIDSTLIVGMFLIRAFEERHGALAVDEHAQALAGYEDNEAFNEFWDDTFGEFVMGDYSYTASEILFNLDQQAYQTESKAFGEVGQE